MSIYINAKKMIRDIFKLSNAMVWEVLYFVLYQLFHRFSGAHKKPKMDSKFDPTIEHHDNYFYKKLRNLEHSYWLDSPLSKSNPRESNIMPVIELRGNQINPKIFLSATKNKTCPVILRGVLKNTNAVKLWNKDFFYKYADTKLLALVGEGANKFNAYTSFTRALTVKKISLENFLDNLDMIDKKMIYINNVTSIFVAHPELIKDLNINILKRLGSNITNLTWLKVNLFMGGPGTGSSLHCAGAGNYFFNVYGKKKWVLIDPIYTKFLKSTPAKDLSFVISGRDIEDKNDEVLSKIPRYEFTLEPGDILYNPPWWWHYVKNESDFTIGCAIRDHETYWQSWKNNYMFMAMSTLKYRMNPWMLKLAEMVYGREEMVKLSMTSDRDIMNSLSKN